MSTVFAEGSWLYGSWSAWSGSNLKGMVSSLPVVVVAANVILEDLRRGIRKVDVQPAPRIRRSTVFGALRSIIDEFVFDWLW